MIFNVRARPFYAAAVLALSIGFSGCGDDSPTAVSMVTTTTTSIPARASVQLEIADIAAFSSGQGNLLRVDIVLTESGGVPARINFARLEVFRATGEFEERQEIGSDQIVAGAGDNLLEANSTERARLTFIFLATVKSGRRLTLTLGLTDQSGNDIEIANSFIFR